MVKVTNTTTRCELAAFLVGVNLRAKRCQTIVGNEEHPTEWDAAHALIDVMLLDWQHATA